MRDEELSGPDEEWVAVVLRPLDPRDGDDVVIGRWPAAVFERARADAAAVADEHAV